MKDMPAVSPDGLICGAIPVREDNRDVFVSKSGKKLSELPENPIIGTSSLRRAVMVKDMRPDAEIKPKMVNIHTRLKKLEEEKRIQITCYGNFEVLIDGNPVKFKFEKTKELLAYLVHRKGARCSSKEVIANLWEDDGHDSYYRMLKKDLQDVLNSLGCGDIIYSERGKIGLANLQCIQCDYFKWIENAEEGRKLYHGEYMEQYSWGSETNAFLDMDKYK